MASKFLVDPENGKQLKVKKSHKFRNFVVLPAAGLIAIAIASTANHGTKPTGVNGPSPAPGAAVPGVPAPAAMPAAPAATHTVHYEIRGAGSGLVTYIADGNMGMSQENGAELPWSKDIKLNQYFAPVAVSVQHSSGSGPVTCKIVVDGKTVANNTATGQYAIASCNGTAQ